MSQSKIDFLRSEGLLNPRAKRVAHSLFRTTEFFDPLDLSQVRYEMLRCARGEGSPVAEACRLFGYSREYFYQLERDFEQRGLVALLAGPRGRRPLLALNQEIVNFIVHRKIENPKLSGEALRDEILRIYRVKCTSRTVNRVIDRLGLAKKGAQ
jgi:transposase